MAKYPQKYRSNVAMRVVMLDRQKFNEAVAAGHYECAPPTFAGKVRLFSDDDLVVLFVFARLLEMQISTRNAGRLACEFRNAMVDRSGKGINERITYVRGLNADFFTKSKDYDPDHEAKGRHYEGAGSVILAAEFYVPKIREIIADRIEREKAILGIEGEDD